MPALSLPQLQSRVRAWHNRHPLARRIPTSQVISIGEVLLPFACAEASAKGDTEAELDRVSEFGLPPAPVRPPPATAQPVPAAAAPTQRPPPVPQAPPASDDDSLGEAALELPPLDAPLRPPQLTPDAPAGPAPRPEADATEPRPDTPPVAAAGDEAPRPPAETPPARGGGSGWTALRWRRPRLVAAFSRSIVWPLSARQIARWALKHGQPQPLLPADGPRRQLEPDARCQAQALQQGLPGLMHLHLLSATVQIGDRRMRVLMDPQGAVLGQRDYSPPRVKSAVSMIVASLLAAGLALGSWWPGGVDAGGGWAGHSAAEQTLQASSAASAASASAPAADETAVASAAPLPGGADGAAAQQPPAVATAASAAADTAASAPAEVTAPLVQHQPMARIRPGLSEADKLAAREQSARLRALQAPARPAAAAVAAAPAPVYAVVSAPSRQRQAAQRGLQLMIEARHRLPPPSPTQGELLHQQGVWRAAWWPFVSLADAERARVMLAGRGLQAEVVAF